MKHGDPINPGKNWGICAGFQFSGFAQNFRPSHGKFWFEGFAIAAWLRWMSRLKK